jgi:Flp pilus assembly protein TadG
MTTRELTSMLRRRISDLAADRRGISVVEFSLLLPLMLTMYLGTLEVTDAISADRQVTLAASTIANVTSQYTSVSDAEVSNILAAAAAVFSPFPIANAEATLTSVAIDGNGNATVAWSATLNGTERSGNVTALIPAELRIANTSIIWGEAIYNYKPVIGYVVTGTLPLTSQIFVRPRISSSVIHS